MSETFQGKCPQCGHEEVKPTVKQLHNVMNEYTATVDGKIVTTVINSLDEVIEGKNGVKWTKVTKNKSFTAVPLAAVKPELLKGLETPPSEVAGNDKTGVAAGAVIKGSMASLMG